MNVYVKTRLIIKDTRTLSYIKYKITFDGWLFVQKWHLCYFVDGIDFVIFWNIVKGDTMFLRIL